MTIVYNYITVASEGNNVHIKSFVKAYRALDEAIIENGTTVASYMGDKETWSVRKRLMVKLQWLTDNIKHCVQTWHMARSHKSVVLLFRFQPLHDFFLSIVVLSYFYPVVLEINAIRSIEYSEGRPRISDFLDWLSLASARRVFVVSQRLKEHLIDHYKLRSEQIAVIENGVDPDEFHPGVSGQKIRKELRIDGRFVIGFIGSFRPWHGINYLIAMAEHVIPQLPHAFFLLVGDGPDRPVYERKVHEKGLIRHFYFTGHVTHEKAPQYLAAMDVVMSPFPKQSYTKGFYGSTLKIFEYMAMAKPIIAPPLGQTSEVIEDGISGLLIDSEDTSKLIRVTLDLHRNPIFREQLGRNARARAMKQYTWKMNAEKVRKLCMEACNV